MVLFLYLIEKVLGLVALISFLLGCVTTVALFLLVAIMYFANEKQRRTTEQG